MFSFRCIAQIHSCPLLWVKSICPCQNSNPAQENERQVQHWTTTLTEVIGLGLERIQIPMCISVISYPREGFSSLYIYTGRSFNPTIPFQPNPHLHLLFLCFRVRVSGFMFSILYFVIFKFRRIEL